jgi:serine protease Do|tara:strand:- start:3524 stop:4597 length:1074 start_codon:yes stop_codon:yes gene_type:complete
VKKIISIIVLVIFSSVSFAEEWKWENAYNSVVLISGEKTPEKIIGPPAPESSNPLDKNTEFDIPIPKQLPEYGMGTGFFINKVHLVTNYHVIKNFDTLKVYTYNHPFAITEVKVIGYDEEIDIAVLEIKEKVNVSFVEWADTEPLIGDDVYALGHGVSQIWSLTKGILSYDYRPNAGTSFVHYLQTDAVINQGNSGGPLLNEDGKVVGVNSLLISPDKNYVGYGYVIPTPLVKRVVEQILATGQHVKPSIGIVMGLVDNRDLYNNLKDIGIDHFLEIKETTKNSSAERFGLLANDIIVSIDDKNIQLVPDVIKLLWERNPGDQISFKVYRKGEYKTINVVLAKVEPKSAPIQTYGNK